MKNWKKRTNTLLIASIVLALICIGLIEYFFVEYKNSLKNWAMLQEPNRLWVIWEKAVLIEMVAILTVIAFSLGCIYLLWWFRNSFLRELAQTQTGIEKLHKGEEPQCEIWDKESAIGKINGQINQIGSNLKKLNYFIRDLSHNPDAEYVLWGKGDFLGKTFLNFVKQEKTKLEEKEKQLIELRKQIEAQQVALQGKDKDCIAILQSKDNQLQTAYQQLINSGNELRQNAEEMLAVYRELANAKKELESKNTELEDLNKEKNHLIGIVAHDLRNPLSSSLSIAELFEEESENLNEDQQEYLKAIQHSLKRMNDMINQILDIKMIESKQLNVYWETIALKPLIKEVCGYFEEHAQNKGQKMICEVETDCVIRVDRNYLTQIIENLVSNAIKFSPFGKNIWVRLQETEDKIQIAIQDEGEGISEDDMPKLFGKYQQLSARPTGGEKSTGLGLSIVRKYVEAMNGRVWCESEAGKGAKFVVEFSVG